MRIRFRGPSGGGFLELADDATVAHLLSALTAEIGSGAIAVKFGWPLQTLAADQADVPVRELGLQRENLTIIPVESPAQQPSSGPAAAAPAAPAAADPGPAELDAQLAATLSFGSGEDVKVEMPESRTNLGMYHTTPVASPSTTHQGRSQSQADRLNTSATCHA